MVRTILIRRNKLLRYGFLFRYLILQVFLPLLEHIELFAEFEDCFFGGIAALLRGLATKPGPHLGGGVFFCVSVVVL